MRDGPTSLSGCSTWVPRVAPLSDWVVSARRWRVGLRPEGADILLGRAIPAKHGLAELRRDGVYETEGV